MVVWSLTEVSCSAVRAETVAARAALRLTGTSETPYRSAERPVHRGHVRGVAGLQNPAVQAEEQRAGLDVGGVVLDPRSMLIGVLPSRVTGWSPMVIAKLVMRGSWRSVHANW